MMSSRSKCERSAPHIGIGFSRKIFNDINRCSSIHAGSFLSPLIFRTSSSSTPFLRPSAYEDSFASSKISRLSPPKIRGSSLACLPAVALRDCGGEGWAKMAFVLMRARSISHFPGQNIIYSEELPLLFVIDSLFGKVMDRTPGGRGQNLLKFFHRGFHCILQCKNRIQRNFQSRQFNPCFR